MHEPIWTLLGLAALAWLYYGGIRVREAALQAGRAYCDNIGVQFLDETVSRESIGFARDPGGMLRIARRFSFEFTSDGERRYQGEIRTLGDRVVGTRVELHRILH